MSLIVIEDHTLHTRFLNETSVVLDLGANRGSFAKTVIDRFHCRCVAVEPSPEMFAKIEPHPLLQKYNVAITASEGAVDFHLSDIPVSSSLAHKPEGMAGTITVTGRRLDNFISELGLSRIDLLKMDIEGVEIDVLRSCSDQLLQSIGQLTIEFHDHMNVVSKSDIELQVDRLERLGFICLSRYLGCYYDTLFINQAFCPISQVEYLWYRHVIRNWEGLGRRLQKLRGVSTSV